MNDHAYLAALLVAERPEAAVDVLDVLDVGQGCRSGTPFFFVVKQTFIYQRQMFLKNELVYFHIRDDKIHKLTYDVKLDRSYKDCTGHGTRHSRNKS